MTEWENMSKTWHCIAGKCNQYTNKIRILNFTRNIRIIRAENKGLDRRRGIDFYFFFSAFHFICIRNHNCLWVDCCNCKWNIVIWLFSLLFVSLLWTKLIRGCQMRGKCHVSLWSSVQRMHIPPNYKQVEGCCIFMCAMQINWGPKTFAMPVVIDFFFVICIRLKLLHHILNKNQCLQFEIYSL